MSSPDPSSQPLSAVLGAAHQDSPALVSPDDSFTLSFGELGARVDQLAGRLRAIGVERGERVALALPNGPEIVQLLLAVTTLGGAAAPLNPAYTEDEFRFYLDDLAPRPAPAAGGRARRRETRRGLDRGRRRHRRTWRHGRAGLHSRRARGVRLRARPSRRRRDAPPHERDDEPPQAGASPPAQPRRVREVDRLALRAGRRGRLVLRDAALPHPRGRRVDARSAARRRLRGRAATPRAAELLAAARRPRRHVVLGRPDDPPDAARAGTTRSAQPALRPLVLLCALPRPPRALRGRVRRADARGLRDDRGEPPDGREPASAARASPRIGRRPDRRPRSARSTRRGSTSRRKRPARS